MAAPAKKRLPVHKGWLLALAYIGTISHPALDWLNNYGVRLLEPFSSQWFYGDTHFHHRYLDMGRADCGRVDVDAA